MPERTQPQRLSHDTASDTRTPETSPPEHAHPPAHRKSLAGAMQLYPQAAAALFAAMQAVLLLRCVACRAGRKRGSGLCRAEPFAPLSPNRKAQRTLG